MIPKIIFGRCPRRGHLGPDYSSADISSADTVEGDSGNGYPLEYYRGELMCEMCKKRLIQDEESLDMADRHSEEEQFRANAGFKRTIT